MSTLALTVMAQHSQSAPSNGRVKRVNATIEAAATPTITTHRNTASSEIFI